MLILIIAIPLLYLFLYVVATADLLQVETRAELDRLLEVDSLDWATPFPNHLK